MQAKGAAFHGRYGPGNHTDTVKQATVVGLHIRTESAEALAKKVGVSRPTNLSFEKPVPWRGSFRPAAEIATLRVYMRHRERLVEYAAAHIQHMQKALMEMNLQLHHVVSDINGATGMRIPVLQPMKNAIKPAFSRTCSAAPRPWDLNWLPCLQLRLFLRKAAA